MKALSATQENPPYSDEERRAARGALFDRYGEVPIPERRVWELQADIERLKQRIEENHG